MQLLIEEKRSTEIKQMEKDILKQKIFQENIFIFIERNNIRRNDGQWLGKKFL